MIDAAFQDQVDRCLAALEEAQPALHRLRRVPMDLIAEAVERELRPVFTLTVPAESGLRPIRIQQWKDEVVKRAITAIAIRNGDLVRAKIDNLTADAAAFIAAGSTLGR